MKSRIVFLLVLSFFLISCSTSAETNTETNEVEQSEETNDSRVVTIQEKTFEMDDLDFYTLMNRLKIALQMDETKNDEEISYLKEQVTYYENINVNLQSLIELYAMSLLAEGKIISYRMRNCAMRWKILMNKLQVTRKLQNLWIHSDGKNITEISRNTLGK